MGNGKSETAIKVAAIQFEPQLGKLEDNRRRIIAFATEAAQAGARLIVFPEMATSGYVWKNRQEIAPFVETIPGVTTDLLSDITRQYDCYIVIGLPEQDMQNGMYYNSAVLVGPEGIVGAYRKTHLFAADPRWACEGTKEIPVFETSIGNIALLICMDAMYFEPARIATLKGADIIAFSTNWVGASGNKPPSNTWRLRAKENGIFWIASNRFGVERGAHFTGGSAMIEPTGDVQASCVTGEAIVFGEIRQTKRTTNTVASRKPQAYQDMLLHSYLWSEGETRPSVVDAPFDVSSVSLPPFSTLSALVQYVEAYHQETTFTSSNRLVVLSEIAFSGDVSLDACQTALIKLATQYNVYFIASYQEKEKNAPVSFLVHAEGCLGQYEQVHAGEGTSFCVVELPFLRVGLLTGVDAQFPESYRVLAKRGADLIAVSANKIIDSELWEQKIRAYENDVILAQAVAESGGNLIFLHSQVALESSNEVRSIQQYFAPDRMKKIKERPFLRRLKHHLYEKLVEEIAVKEEDENEGFRDIGYVNREENYAARPASVK